MTDFDRYTDEAIDCLAIGNINQAADALEEIAYTFAKAGYTLEEFEGWRKMIIGQARIKARQSGVPETLFEIKIKDAERACNERRNGDRKIILIN